MDFFFNNIIKVNVLGKKKNFNRIYFEKYRKFCVYSVIFVGV